jgi:lysozyme
MSQLEMSADMKIKLKTLLIKHEGNKNFPYHDTMGKITIGIGYNLSDRGVSNSWIDATFNDDANETFKILNEQYSWFSELSIERQIVLIDMAWFGIKKFSEFVKMINALEKHDYQNAAKEILNSKYKDQVGQRAHDIANTILTGEL